MPKTIKVKECQVRRLIGEDFEYLENGDFQGYDGNTRVSTTSTMSDGTNGNPLTGDKYASMQSPQSYFNLMNVRSRRRGSGL